MRAADNPFRAGRIEALPLRGVSWSELAARFERAGERGIVLGPMGSGKTTALLEGQEYLRSANWRVTLHTLRADEPVPGVREVRSWLSNEPRRVVLVDGFDLLSWRSRRLLCQSGPVLAAGHRACGLPVLWRFETSPQLLAELLTDLLGAAPEDYGLDVRALWMTHGGDIREVFGSLYTQWSHSDG